MSWHLQQKQKILLLERVQIKAEQSTLALVWQLFRSASANPAPKSVDKGMLPEKALFCKLLTEVKVKESLMWAEDFHIVRQLVTMLNDKHSFRKKKSSVKVHSQELSSFLLLVEQVSATYFLSPICRLRVSVISALQILMPTADSGSFPSNGPTTLLFTP